VADPPYSRFLGALRLAAVYGLLAALVVFSRPRPLGALAGTLLVAAGEGLRIWAAGHLTKNAELTTSGPYRHTRNPLYLGRLLIFSGLCAICRLPRGAHGIVWLAGCAVFFGYYLPRKERVEPARLLAIHGPAAERYLREVPALFPALRPYDAKSDARWSLARLRRNREHWMVAGLTAVTAWLLSQAWAVAPW
jgi:protein-S-isoprenylcysteine O-methyltransferase Ste14